MKNKKLKPNKMPLGTFLISIDDGFVEYMYRVKPKKGSDLSINDIHKSICVILEAKSSRGKVREPKV
jgi:hypothetical protein